MMNYSFIHLNDASEFQAPYECDYALLLLIEGNAAGATSREEMSDKIAASRCIYFSCAGSECSLWDDEVDWSAIEQNKDIMTTWHDGQELEEILDFFLRHVSNPRGNKIIDFKCIMSLGGNGSILERCKNIMKEMKA